MNDGDIELRLRTLGERLRALRVERGASLGDVSAGTGLSTSFLSLVENGRSDISTGRLFRVARFLGVALGDLLEMDAEPELRVVRADERRSPDGVSAAGLSMFPVLDDHEDVTMAPIVCEYEPGAHVHDVPATEGVEHFVFVVGGGIEISIAAAEPLVLAAGDCAYIRSDGVSAVRNVADRRSVIVWVSSPPAFGRVRAAMMPGPASGH